MDLKCAVARNEGGLSIDLSLGNDDEVERIPRPRDVESLNHHVGKRNRTQADAESGV